MKAALGIAGIVATAMVLSEPGHRLVVVAALIALGLLVLGVRRFSMRHHLHRHRVRTLRIRLFLHLHPGPGHASGWELWRHFGRLASWRESRRTRPSLGRWHCFRHPQAHAWMLGRAHHFRRVWASVQEHVALIGPPRSWKTALLSRQIMDHDGPVVVTSSKPDLYNLTAAVRARRGPIWVWNPGNVGGIGSNVRWSPLEGCQDTSTAIRRADSLAQGVSTSGTDDAQFWNGSAAEGMRGIFNAAARDGKDMRAVSRWAGSGVAAMSAVAVLRKAGLGDWADKLAELYGGSAERTSATVRMVMNRMVGFMNDPVLADAALPGPGEAFSVEDFLASGGTLYMLSRSDQEESPMAPPFVALAAEIHHRAITIGSRMEGGRHDPPVFFALDEVTQTCPLPLPYLLADSGGQGVSVWFACHGHSQLVQRWKAPGAQTIMNTANIRVIMPGLADADTLRDLARLIGQRSYSQGDKATDADVLTTAMIRQLPAKRCLVIRSAHSPVVVKVAPGWKHPEHKRLKKAGRDVYHLQQPGRLQAVPLPPAERQTAGTVTTMPAADPAAGHQEAAPTAPAWSPSAVLAAHKGNGNGTGHPGHDDGPPWWAES